jgi:hypothetical protein
MREVSGLSMGNRPYEDYVPVPEELHILEKMDPAVLETYWELMCHFHICCELTGVRSSGVTHMRWATYLFPGLGDQRARVSRVLPCTEDELKERLSKTEAFYTTDSKEDVFKSGTIFESFHRQACTPISDRALLAGFLMLWLKRCVVPTLPHEVVIADVIYPAAMLAHGRPLGLLQAMMSCLQSGLRTLVSSFCVTTAVVNVEGEDVVDESGVPKCTTLNPRIELPYTYLVAWYVMHCPALMSAVPDDDAIVPYVQRLEHCKWTGHYPAMIRHTLQSSSNYHYFRCAPDFPNALLGEWYEDGVNKNEYTSLSAGAFEWLISIRPGHLVFRQGPTC